MNSINGLIRYMNHLERKYGYRIVIKDYIGFLQDEKFLFCNYERFCVHQSPYCMAMKKEDWNRCLDCSNKVYEKLKRDAKSFFGYCCNGVGEFIVPLVSGRDPELPPHVIGSINIGGYIPPDYKNDNPLYTASLLNNNLNLKTIEDQMTIISEYLSMYFESEIMKMLDQPVKETGRQYVISNAIAYIQHNYKSNVTLDEICQFCHSSRSFISHHFKKSTGVTVKSYVNQCRIAEACILLDNTAKSVTEVGYTVGFKDSNYFSKVFKDFKGLSPDNYRKKD